MNIIDRKTLKSILSTKTGTRINANPLVVFSDEYYYFYLNCRNVEDSNCHQLYWEVLIHPMIDKNLREPSFLKNALYVDTSVLFQMRKNEFIEACTTNNIEYAQLEGKYIHPKDRLNIIEKLLPLLGYRKNYGTTKTSKADIALINCALDMARNTKFRIDYCSIHYLYEEKRLFKEGITPYNFFSEEQKNHEEYRIKIHIPVVILWNKDYLFRLKKGTWDNDFIRVINFCLKVKETSKINQAN